MIPTQIERDVLIEAPIEVVWHTVTDSQEITQWFSDAAELEAVAGSVGSLTFEDRATTRPVVAILTVQEVDPPHRFSFRWSYEEGTSPAEGNSVLVEFILASEGERTRLRVVESGIGAMPWGQDEAEQYTKEHEAGWSAIVGRLSAYLAARPETASKR